MLAKYDKYIVIKFIYNIQMIINEYINTIGISIGYDDCFIPLYKKEDKININKNLSLIVNNSNFFGKIINSGSKGSNTNLLQILIRVGQQYIKNRKVDNLNFIKINSYCYNSFSEGLNYYEYFYHSQSCREGVINTNIRTPNIEYIQRQLSKFLEGLITGYDGNNIYNQFIMN